VPLPGVRRYHHNVPVRASKRIVRKTVRWIAVLCAALYLFAIGELILLRWIEPPTTMVQVQRRVEAFVRRQPYHKRYEFVSLEDISANLHHAVVAAEDDRFYEHHGIDWKAVQQILDQDFEQGRLGRGGSTITQQLVKNLFFTTSRNILRKAVEFTLAPVAELLLSKQRILELYLNVVEWGPGVYGAEAASETWYGVSARRLNRDQAARLAALLPAPRRRRPQRMDAYSRAILRRMTQHGW